MRETKAQEEEKKKQELKLRLQNRKQSGETGGGRTGRSECERLKDTMLENSL